MNITAINFQYPHIICCRRATQHKLAHARAFICENKNLSLMRRRPVAAATCGKYYFKMIVNIQQIIIFYFVCIPQGSLIVSAICGRINVVSCTINCDNSA